MAGNHPTSFKDLLLPFGDTMPKVDKQLVHRPLLNFEPTANEHRPTRHSSNHEWHRDTFKTVVAPQESHFFASENERFHRQPWVDEEAKKNKQRHTETIKNKVRSKTDSQWWPTGQ